MEIKPRHIFEWDVKNWSRVLPIWESALNSLNNSNKITALEIGGRGGGLSLWLAKHKFNVVCSYHNTSIDSARRLHQKFGVSSNVTYRKIDALDIPYKEKFDVVILKSVIGAVGSRNRFDLQKKMMSEIYNSLKPGGVFLFAENIKSTNLHDYFRKCKRGDSWRYLTLEDMSVLLSAYDMCKLETYGFIGCFGRTEYQKELLACLDSLISPLVPSEWNYLVGGSAFKKIRHS